MNEFSPGVVGELAPLLESLISCDGDRRKLVLDIIASASKIASTQDPEQRRKRANNVLIGMSQCGIVKLLKDRYELTEFGRALAAQHDVAAQYRQFAAHLLTHCYGDELLAVVRSLHVNDIPCTKVNVNEALKQRGFHQTTNEGDAGKIRQWLQKAAVTDAEWAIDEAKYAELVGATAESESAWKELERPKVALLTTLRDLNLGDEVEWHDGAHVKRICLERFGAEVLPEADLRRRVVDPLVADGWIEAEGTNRDGRGRGGKIGRMRPTRRLMEGPRRFGLPDADEIHRRARAKITDLPLAALGLRLIDGDKYERGIALEVLALRLAVMAGLEPGRPRVRTSSTGTAEVDLFAEGAHLMYSRWLFQCKNTPNQKVRLEDLAREVGLAVVTNAHVVVIVTTGLVTQPFRNYARKVEQTTHIQIVLIDKERLERILTGGGPGLVEVLAEEAKQALLIKKGQLDDALKLSDDTE